MWKKYYKYEMVNIYSGMVWIKLLVKILDMPGNLEKLKFIKF